MRSDNTQKRRSLRYGIILIILAALILPVGAAVGSAGIGIDDIFSIVLSKLTSIKLPEHISVGDVQIIWGLRMPRVLLAFTVGAVLSASGAVMQSVLRNPLSSAFTLGVSSGASLGAAVVIITGFAIPLLGEFTLPLTGFVCGMVTIFILLIFCRGVDSTLSGNTIILAGMVMSLFFSSIITVITAMSRTDMNRIVMWQMGSFAMRGFKYIALGAPFFIIGLVLVFMNTKELDILTFGDEQALSMGVNVPRVKTRLLIAGAMLAGSAVSLTGTIGFIDLVSPHIVRRLFGSNHKVVIPMSMLFGGTLMVLTDLIARTIISPAEMPVGAITSIIGAPFFAFIYFKKRK